MAGLPPTRLERVVVETDADVAEWVAEGISRDRIEVVGPGIDLTWHRRAPQPQGRLTLLFASSPPEASEIGPRGIALLAELARVRPDIDILLPSREWGDIQGVRRALELLHAPANFRIEFGNVLDMRTYYARAHATIICFERGVGKGCPNFVIEGLAVGRPCIATTTVGLSRELERAGAGIVVARDVAALSGAVDRLQTDWEALSARARQLAESQFGLDRFRSDYERIYGELAQRREPDRLAAQDQPPGRQTLL